MLGEAAVGLYGLVQRTTAVVELAWASISKLLLQSYAGSAAADAAQDVRRGMVTAVKRTLVIMVIFTGLVWIIGSYVEYELQLSHETSVGLSLLKWGLVAMTWSSLKRPLIAGLLAFHHERAVCRTNLYSAAAGLVLVPILILWLGIWGPIVGWIVVEAAACLLLFHHALSVPYAPPSGLGASIPERAGA
jgi:O-antigen/teichoic acid export membrane protein